VSPPAADALPLPPVLERLPRLTPSRGPFFRIHPADRRALHFGRAGRWRFDAPAGRFGVLYAAEDLHGAFVETFLRVPGPGGRVSRADLAARAVSRVGTRRPLRLLDLTGANLSRLRLDAQLFATMEYARTQAWAAAFHDHPDAPDGLRYRSRHDPDRFAVALFDRAEPALRERALAPSLTDEAFLPRLAEVLETYAVALV
jgi:hypothetical protein